MKAQIRSQLTSELHKQFFDSIPENCIFEYSVDENVLSLVLVGEINGIIHFVI